MILSYFCYFIMNLTILTVSIVNIASLLITIPGNAVTSTAPTSVFLNGV